jgi:hypothetical protein
MPSSGMLRHVALARTNVSEERIASIIRVTRIGELGTTLTIISNRRTLVLSYVLTIFTRRNILADSILRPAVLIRDSGKISNFKNVDIISNCFFYVVMPSIRQY